MFVQKAMFNKALCFFQHSVKEEHVLGSE